MFVWKPEMQFWLACQKNCVGNPKKNLRIYPTMPWTFSFDDMFFCEYFWIELNSFCQKYDFFCWKSDNDRKKNILPETFVRVTTFARKVPLDTLKSSSGNSGWKICHLPKKILLGKRVSSRKKIFLKKIFSWRLYSGHLSAVL